MGLAKNSSHSFRNIFKHIIDNSKNLDNLIENFHPKSLTDTMRNLSISILDNQYLKMIHIVVFDPAWLCNDNIIPITIVKGRVSKYCFFRDFGTYPVQMPFDFFEGAFAYHIHMDHICKKPKLEVLVNSYFYYYDKHYRDVLNLK